MSANRAPLAVESAREASGVRIALRILGDARAFWPHLALIFLLSLASTPLTLLTPVPVKIVADNVIGGKPLLGLLHGAMAKTGMSLVLFSACLALAIALLQALQNLTVWIYQRYIGERLVMAMRGRLLRHVQRLSLSQHGERGTADLLYHLQNDILNMQYFVISGLIPFATSAVTFLMMFVVTVRLDREIALLVLGVLPAYWAASRWQAGRSRPRWRRVKETERGAIAILQETLHCIRVVKAFGQEERQAQRFSGKAWSNLDAYLGAMGTDSMFTLSVAAALAIATAASIYIGAMHIQSGALSLGSFLILMSYLNQLLRSVEILSRQGTTSQNALASAARVYSLFACAPIVEDIEPAVRLERSKGAIEFREVSFGYRSGRANLQDVSFTVRPGARVGIVGPTGAGKTTLIGLLVRFHDPSSGAVLMDGVDLRRIRQSDLRNQFAQVPQEPILFSGTITENIAYGRPGATMDEIVRAAQDAEAHDFVVNLPDGYDTEVGEGGKALSGGERQRISIARAFLLNAPFLILDEPTSSVDDEKGSSIADTLEKLYRDRTTFTVSHRKSFLKNCDVILEIEAGRLVAQRDSVSA